MNKQQTVLDQICRKFDVAFLYSFGSRSAEVREWLEGRRDRLPAGPSDTDIGVQPLAGKKWSVREKVEFAGMVEELLAVSRVDLVCLNEADPFVAAEIIRGERLFAADSHEADEYELFILRRAGDLAPLERERMALVLGELA
ncbi:MAG: nucleotidyltransferase domain-containing protein [Deltaproteobacteria bacterium]|nr:nucleotidyltransferase domain-containing protein [Deltaproteobacteria bacterium]